MTPPTPATALREADEGYEVLTWVSHQPSGVVVLKGHPQLGGRYCQMDGGDWPCAAVRAALAATEPAGLDADIEAKVDDIVERYGGALDALAAPPTPATAHEHDFITTRVDGVVVDLRCACGAVPLDLLADRVVTPRTPTTALLVEAAQALRESVERAAHNAFLDDARRPDVHVQLRRFDWEDVGRRTEAVLEAAYEAALAAEPPALDETALRKAMAEAAAAKLGRWDVLVSEADAHDLARRYARLTREVTP